MTKINIAFRDNRPNMIGVYIDKDFCDISRADIANAIHCEEQLIVGWAINLDEQEATSND